MARTFDYATKAWVDLRTLAELKAERTKAMQAAAKAADSANIGTGNNVFVADADARTALMQEAQMAQMAIADGLAYSLDWERADGTAINLTGPQVRGLLRAMSNRAQAIRATLRTKLAQVADAQSISAVKAVIW